MDSVLRKAFLQVFLAEDQPVLFLDVDFQFMLLFYLTSLLKIGH